MNPILYPSTETAFASNGLGVLSGAISCTVTEELNGSYELAMQYPITGIHYDLIQQLSLLYCKPGVTGQPQPFRVYRITKPINGIVTVYAAHISYDLSGIPVKPCAAGSAAAAMLALENNAAVDSPFTFWTDINAEGNFSVAVPATTRAALGGRNGSILSVYGGELEFDHYAVKLHGQRGTDRGMTIRYGKNLTSLEQDENCSNVYTGVYPYAKTGDTLTELPEKIVNAPGAYDFIRILPLDLSGEFEEAPTEAQLRAAAEKYIESNNIGIPEIALKVSYAQLEQAEEYKHLTLMERVELGDTVNVEFPALGVSAAARCVKTVYNVLLDRYDSIELGDGITTIADTIAQQQAAIKGMADAPVSTAVQAAIANATALITGNKGGYVILHSSTGAKEPDEILIMDTPDIETAVNVWRWNKSGLGYSSTGYNGPYGTAITADGQIVADYITAGGMDAARITAGILTSADGRTQIDLTAGTVYFRDANNNIKLGFADGSLTISGHITATSGSFTGSVYASSGEIGGFSISGGNLIGSQLSLYPVASAMGYSGGGINLGGAELVGYSAALNAYTDRLNLHGALYVDDAARFYDDVTIDGSTLSMPNIRTGTYEANLRWDTDYGYFYRSTSSRRYKHDITDISGWERIYELRPVNYVGNDDESGRIQCGFIAEEMAETMPELVELLRQKDGSTIPEGVFYNRITAPLVRAVQDLNERLKKLEEA